MKKFRPVLLLFALLVNQAVFSQGWEYTLPDVGTLSRGHDIIQASDGNYLNIGFQSGGTSSDTFGYYALKIDDQGDVLWRKNLPSTIVTDTKVTELSNGHFVFFGSYPEEIAPSTFSGSPTLVGIDQLGNKEWEIKVNLNIDGNIYHRHTLANDDGTFNFAASKNNKSVLWKMGNDGTIISGDSLTFNAQLAERKSDGNLIWFNSTNTNVNIYLTDASGNLISTGSNTIQGTAKQLIAKDGQCYILSEGGSTSNSFIYQYKIDDAYSIVDSDILYVGQFARFNDMVLDDDGILYAGYTGLNPNPDDAAGYAMKTDFDGNIVWTYLADHVPAGILFEAIAPSFNDGYILTGEFIQGINKSYIIKLDENGVLFGSSMSGTVAIDQDENCIVNTGEQPIPDWYITAEKNADDLFPVAVSGLDGNYATNLDTGNYSINLIEDGYYWSVCDNNVAISVPTFSEDINLDFSVEALEDCPQMTVNANTYWSSPCEVQPLFITYKNKGTVLAESAYLEIQLDTAYTAISSEIPWTTISSDNVVRIDLGDVEPLAGETFIIEISLSCDAFFGNSYLIDAHVYPDTICGTIPPQYSGAFLESSAGCNLDSVYFQITNTGLEPMDVASPFFIVEDAVLMNQGIVPTLNPQENYDIALPATGGTYTLIYDQVEFAPGFSFPITIIEGCAPNGSSNFSTGFTNQFPLNDENSSLDLDYIVATENPVAPNNIFAQPKGYALENYIEPTTRLTYQIDFQNTSSQIVSQLIIRTDFDPSLDLSTIRMEGSSHEYKLSFENENQLVLTFDDIDLPAMAVNNLANQGIVAFSILPKKSVSIGAKIRQSALLEFDQQISIQTEEIVHTIGEDFIVVDIPSSILPEVNYPKVTISPNPVNDKINIQLDNYSGGEYQVELFNIEGILLFKNQITRNRFSMNRNGLSSGFYFYKITGPNGWFDSGKIILK